ncbi:MAG: rod shape-determining protein MreD [Acidimicrobiales bacterium]
MTINAIRLGLVTTIALVLQTTLFTELRIAGIAPELILALAAISGFVAGPNRGAIAGFWMGLAYDVVLETPLGLAGLAFCLVVYGAGIAGERAFRPTWWFAAGACAVSSALGVIVLAVVGALVGGGGVATGGLISVLLGVALLNALLAPLVMAAVRWGYGRPRELRAVA